MGDRRREAFGRPGEELPELTDGELRRYARHLILPEVGEAGQRQLKAARVLLVGAGGLGSPAGLYLAAAGVGTLGIVDFDRVELSNLQRQVLFGDPDLGRPKVEAAAEHLGRANPHVILRTHEVRLAAANADQILGGYDLVVDGSDNFATRYLVNDTCVRLGLPDVWGAVSRFEGQLAVFWADHGPCYRCLFPEPPPSGAVPSCAEGGVLGVLPGIIGALQAAEAIKLILGHGEPAVGRFVTFDALALRFRELRLRKDPDCPGCGAGPRPREERDVAARCDAARSVAPAEGESLEIPIEISPRELHSWRQRGRRLTLLDVREPFERSICCLEGARLIPLGELPQRLDELRREELIVAHCHLGARSAQAVAYLRRQGFAKATNLAGGIDGWSREIDPSVPRY